MKKIKNRRFRRKTYMTLIVSILCMGATVLSGFKMEAQVDTNAKIKSLFIYNFTKYVDWPVDRDDGDFIIGVYGNYPSLVTELNSMAESRKRGNQAIQISSITSPNDVQHCHILYVEPGVLGELPGVLKNIEGKSILLVTDGAGLAKQGAGISFYDAQNKQKMEINPKNVEKHNLKISSQLMALATIVE